MRTMLTIEDDVARELGLRMQREGTNLESLVNQLLRRALRVGEKPLPRALRIETFSSEFVPGVDVSRLNQMNDELEIAAFTRKRSGEGS